MPRLRLCILWHMHQPIYRDPESGDFILPWVRLHATRAYYDMAKVLAEHESARAVINLVPSLLWQLDGYVQGRARDRFLDLSRAPADGLSAQERIFIVRNFFMVDWETCIKPLPRYWELLQKRGRTEDLEASAASYSVEELRDLQVLFNLAWMGFRAEEEEETVRALKRKGRLFTEAEKHDLLAVQQKIMAAVMPAYADVWKAGQAELTVTPFYHPILPLLIDSDAARRCMPHATLPPRFHWPEDARAQVRRGLEFAEKNLGARPQGMWPAEGSVSPEAVALLAGEGVKWCATDEGILHRSRPQRDRHPANLYRPYTARSGGKQIDMLFRDRGLSDLIGFTYSRTPAKAALDDLFGHLDAIARSAPRGEIPLVTIALDGENAWEHYPDSGREFLRGLYERLSSRKGDIEPITPGEFLREHRPTDFIDELHTGSWIDSNFRIWIGHPEDNLGWSHLGDARQAIAAAEQRAASTDDQAGLQRVQAAKESLYVAEGSDWFWWYGDDFQTESAAEFDALFRGYVKRAWKELGEVPPAQLDEPIAARARPAASAAAELSPVVEPQGFIRPRLDGRVASYFDWTGSGLYRPGQTRGSMFQSGGLFGAMRFGFDERTLFVRLDPLREPKELLREITSLRVMLNGADRRMEVEVPLAEGPLQPTAGAQAADAGVPAGPVGGGAFRAIVELALPFERLGLAVGTSLAFAVRVMRGSVEVERLPRSGYLTLTVPDADYERKNWKV